MTEYLINDLKNLCSLPGVSGAEDKVAEYIIRAVTPFTDRFFRDPAGNLYVFKKGHAVPPKKLMIAAHMDEVGFMIDKITESDYLKISAVGGFDPRVLIGRSLNIGEKGIKGVIGIKAVHLTTPDERKSVTKINSLYVDIGCSSKEEASKLVSVGDFASFDTECEDFGSGMLKAKAIDDRVGCAVMLELIRSELPFDTWFAFTVQEEIGCRGAAIAANRIMPDIALIIEGTTCAEMADVPDTHKVCRAGFGAVTSFMDRGTIYDKKLYSLLFDISREKNIPLQFKQFVSGGTDASAISVSAGGVRCVGLAAPVRYLHAAVSAVKYSDIAAIYSLAAEFIERVQN